MSYPFILKDSFVSIMIEGKPYNVDSTHMNFDEIVLAIKAGRWDEIEDLISISNAINTYGEAFALGRILVDDGVVYYDAIGEEMFALDNSLTDRIIRMKDEGFDIEPMMVFLDNLMDNPSNTAIQELYGFLEEGNLPITDDGHFLAYKRVRDDFTDLHTGKFDNSIGHVVSMPRNQVDDKRENTCSHGLHFCSLDYLPHFGSYGDNKVVILKINPRDVVSIPEDYNNTKGRCCRYEVAGEHLGDDKTEAFNASVVETKESVSDDDNDSVENVDVKFARVYSDLEGYPTLQKVAEEMGISERTVRRRANKMKDAGWDLIDRSRAKTDPLLAMNNDGEE